MLTQITKDLQPFLWPGESIAIAETIDNKLHLSLKLEDTVGSFTTVGTSFEDFAFWLAQVRCTKAYMDLEDNRTG